MANNDGFFGKLKRLFRPNAPGYELEDEDLEAFGTVVEVVETVHPDHHQGRIAFRGSTWNATSVERIIKSGDRARVVYRENLVWIIEPYNGPAALGEKV